MKKMYARNVYLRFGYSKFTEQDTWDFTHLADEYCKALFNTGVDGLKNEGNEIIADG